MFRIVSTNKVSTGKVSTHSIVTSLVALFCCLATICVADQVNPKTRKDPTIEHNACLNKNSNRKGSNYLIAKVQSLLTSVDTHFKTVPSEIERQLAADYSERTRSMMTHYVDHLHGRCWSEDKVSCATFLSTLHEISSFLRSLSRPTPSEVLGDMVTRTESVAQSLDEYCESLPWRLS